MSEDWRDSALCAQVDGEIFYPGKGDSISAPKRICGRCRVVDVCLTETLRLEKTLSDHIPHGYAGGMSAHQRRNLLKDIT